MAVTVDLEGRVAIVTGAAGGLGREVVAVLREAGASVVAEDLDPAVHDLAVGDEGIAALEGDVADAATADAAVALANERFGHLDLLVNNAARFLLKPILETSDEEWDDIIRTNVRGMFVHARAALPDLIEHRGTMVNIASVSGMVGAPSQAAYCTSKGAVVQLTRQLAVEYGPQGVRVNAVAPGAIETLFVARSLGTEDQGSGADNPDIIASHPLGRVAQPREIAEVVAFVASPLSGFMAGAIVMADGAATAR
jgi:NAD(P)-dependent dehydrogenase (short-subunit alcohol dehydrogenase family)